ncbi:MAG TPA: hypothetical protein IAB31_08170 [Candidatus Choladousia intestinavium]|uniref:Uncharacterized protein n=1 Tax=Candidatus Choladousia intestinavium TaxID=2840727 RepID=A0A9D1AD14_9FIRM|nr:hypothetical protein [Candidatus Choladousia intestinavium]
MDKFFLLTYVNRGEDGFAHSYHAWFETEEELIAFARRARKRNEGMEIDLAIEIYRYREVKVIL